MNAQWEMVIGLEVHAQLSTASKMFSGASTAFGAAPNSQACAVDIALPGVLPVVNIGAVERAIRFGLAVGAGVNRHSVFARKNYFYPDLPKGYQISQFELPIVTGGSVVITRADGHEKTVRLTRAHLEEDAGKSLHEDFSGMTGIDLNRAGTPLLEIVSEPDMQSAEEAVAYAKALHALVRYLEICDGNMQEGSFRCDANVSVRKKGEAKLGTRCEIKNLNSFRFLERAIVFEADRQIEILESGGQIRQETRLFDAEKNETRTMRTKEDAHDYRYFPDPDLLPVVVEDAWIQSVSQHLPELPRAKSMRYIAQYGLTAYDATIITSDRDTIDYFESALTAVPDHGKLLANAIIVDLAGRLNKEDLTIQQSPISAQRLAGLVMRIADRSISSKMAKEVFDQMWSGSGSADQIIAQQGLQQISDTVAIEKFIDDILAANPQQLADYRAGKSKLFAFFVGQLMRATQGKVNPQMANEMLQKKLDGKN